MPQLGLDAIIIEWPENTNENVTGKSKNIFLCNCILIYYYSLNKNVFCFSDTEQEEEEYSSFDADFTYDEETTNTGEE